MPNHAIKVVESMAEREEQPAMRDGSPIFEWRPGSAIEGKYEEEDGEETQANSDDDASVNEDTDDGVGVVPN